MEAKNGPGIAGTFGLAALGIAALLAAASCKINTQTDQQPPAPDQQKVKQSTFGYPKPASLPR